RNARASTAARAAARASTRQDAGQKTMSIAAREVFRPMITTRSSPKLLRLVLSLLLALEPGLLYPTYAVSAPAVTAQPTYPVVSMPSGRPSILNAGAHLRASVETTTEKSDETQTRSASPRDEPSDPAPTGSPPLRYAEDGITAVAGRVLETEGAPLQGVVLKIGTVQTETDADGLFLLPGVSPGAAGVGVHWRPAGA